MIKKKKLLKRILSSIYENGFELGHVSEEV